ncbi:hypothetical protein GUJ93_ZPchr0013g36352 [Zizania palustris]|uniref:Uncharacterized protein n=1 Tax=Zizania palustris TaxID=103762 RepID=A0A8J6BY64_ZIZPA|nr:hypothetical protein GUJ93_ZPchr0013g36352 [Zizania palustris]
MEPHGLPVLSTAGGCRGLLCSRQPFSRTLVAAQRQAGGDHFLESPNRKIKILRIFLATGWEAGKEMLEGGIRTECGDFGSGEKLRYGDEVLEASIYLLFFSILGEFNKGCWTNNSTWNATTNRYPRTWHAVLTSAQHMPAFKVEHYPCLVAL